MMDVEEVPAATKRKSARRVSFRKETIKRDEEKNNFDISADQKAIQSPRSPRLRAQATQAAEAPPAESALAPKKKAQPKTAANAENEISAPRTPRVKKAAAANNVAPIPMSPLEGTSKSKSEAAPAEETPTQPPPATVAHQPAEPNHSPTDEEPKQAKRRRSRPARVEEPPAEDAPEDTLKQKKRRRPQAEPETKDIEEESPPKRSKKAEPLRESESSKMLKMQRPKQVAGDRPLSGEADENSPATPSAPKVKPKRKSTAPAATIAKYNIVVSSCPDGVKDMATELVKKFRNGEIQQSVSADTNVVVLGSKKRTLKTVLGIASGSWLLNSAWIESSVNEGFWSDPSAFEAAEWFPGARKSRLSRKSGAKIFDGIKFHLHGEMEVKKDELESVIVLAGGSVVPVPNQAKCT